MRSSFSNQVKDELARVEPSSEQCARAELEALMRTSGTLHFRGKGTVELRFSTFHAGCARRGFRLLKDLYGVRTEVRVERRQRLHRENVYVTRIPDQPALANLMRELGILDGTALNHRVSDFVAEDPECRAAYLRGCFLGAGSLTHPESQHHLELNIANEEFARDVAGLMKRHGISARVVQKGPRWIVYVKESESVVDFLRLTGAHNSVFAYEDIRIYKDLRNQVNRLVNAETANVTKAIEAAMDQLAAIRAIDQKMGLENLHAPLREVARARLEHPELSLRDLGQQLSPPLGKSAVNYRMRRIEHLADRLLKGKGFTERE